METIDLIVLAAGKGIRTSQPVAKQFLDLEGAPVIVRALAAFERLSFVGKRYIAVHPENDYYVNRLLDQHGISDFQTVHGGSTRQESVRLALEYVRTDRVITHNAAMPFVTPDLIENLVRETYPCVTTVTSMQYGLCRGDEFAEEIVPLEGLKLINTPQLFHTQSFRECHQRAHDGGLAVRSDCELMMRYGYAVKFVEGDPCNFKITTPLDVVLAKSLIRAAQDVDE